MLQLLLLNIIRANFKVNALPKILDYYCNGYGDIGDYKLSKLGREQNGLKWQKLADKAVLIVMKISGRLHPFRILLY